MLTSWDILVAGLITLALILYFKWRRGLAQAKRQFGFTAATLDPRIIGKNKWDSLTTRQKQVARLAARGLSNAEIALHLGITSNTVDAHLKKIYLALGVRSRAGLSYDFKDYID